jgi:hypothetical protein
MTRAALTVLLVLILAIGLGRAAWAQLVVIDPLANSNAVAQFTELAQQFAELVATYEQIRTQYLLLLQQTQGLPVDMNGRYRSMPTPWLPFSATDAYGTTAGWILTANNGHDATAGYTLATQPLLPYGAAMTPLSADEAARVQARYDRVQLTDASIAHGLEALGFLRGHQLSVEQAIRDLEDDTYSANPDFNTQIAMLNKLGATAVTSARLGKDANNILVSLLEQQLLETTERREAAVEGINAHIAFETDASSLLAATTAQTTSALTTFRIP